MTFEELKERYEKAKIESAKADVRIQQIKDYWQQELNVNDVESAELKLTELKSDLESARSEYKKLMEEFENAILEFEGAKSQADRH